MRSLLDKKSLHPLLVPVLLCAAILGIYYPALLSGIHSIDDPSIVSHYASSPPLFQILLPGSSYYYRPLVELTFWLDNRLWGLEPSPMHLENILLHMANALLVYAIARRSAARYGIVRPGLPLCVALTFALHPLNVEAVAWIAGRTDPLLALFGLSGCLFLIKWLDRPHWGFALGTVLFFILALLTKETAVAFLPVAMLLVLIWPQGEEALPRRRRVQIVTGTALTALLLAMAALALQGDLAALRRLLVLEESSLLSVSLQALTAFGFYLRKAFAPFPLNFAITEVSPLHALLAIPGGLLLAFALKRRYLPACFFAAALLLITPVLLLALRNISWTPYAERYMYLPTAFVSLGIGTFLFSLQQRARFLLVPVLMIILLIAGVSSRQRTALWQDKLAFYKDAIAKSPRFGSLYNELGMLHLQESRFAAAAQAFDTAKRLNERPAMDSLIMANIMRTLAARGEYAGAREYFLRNFPSKASAPVVFLETLQRADGKRLPTLPREERAWLSQDLLETFAILYQKTGEPFWLYRGALVAREQKSYAQALELFRKAYAEAPVDATYRLAAGKQIAGLEGLK